MPSLPFDRRWLLTLLIIPAIGLVTCASDEPDTVRIDRPILRLTVDEYRITPQNVSVRAGRLKVEVRNTGNLPHNLVIEQAPEDPEDEPVQVPNARTLTMRPGSAAKPFKVTLAPGTYRLRCSIANHDDLGQYGELKVRAR